MSTWVDSFSLSHVLLAALSQLALATDGFYCLPGPQHLGVTQRLLRLGDAKEIRACQSLSLSLSRCLFVKYGAVNGGWCTRCSRLNLRGPVCPLFSGLIRQLSKELAIVSFGLALSLSPLSLSISLCVRSVSLFHNR